MKMAKLVCSGIKYVVYCAR